MNPRMEAARELALAHAEIDPAVRAIFVVDAEDDRVVRLLEINEDTVPAGVVPISFGPSADFPFASIVVEVTSDEFEAIRSGSLELAAGWTIGEQVFERSVHPGADD